MEEDVQVITGIADDVFRREVRGFLTRNGREPVEACDRDALLDQLQQYPISILLLSDQFAEDATESLLIRLDELQQTTSVLVLFEDAEPDTIQSRIDAGADDFLIRPIREELLEQRVYLAQQNARGRHMESIYSSALEKRVNQRTQQLWDNIRNIRQQFVNTVHALCQALYAKHPYTEGHSWRVAKVSERIAYAMGINGQDLENIRLGALFHDIGKIGIQDQILEKPGHLTEEEYNSVKEHPIIAEEILSPMEEFSDVVDIIKYEHENFDGTGYPYGISGEAIPLGARIVRVADTYDAVVTTRSYREGETHEQAIQEIMDTSGTEFCPEVTRYFRALFHEDEGGLPRAERTDLLGERFESVERASRRGFETEEEFFRDLTEETNEDVVVIGDRSH